jgi:ABC-2 type transport system permease protein
VNRKRIRAIANKEFIQVIRDPRSLAMAIFIPVLLLVMFGFVLDLDVNNVPMIVWNQDNTKTSTDFLLNFKNSRYFDIRGYFDNYRDLQKRIDNGSTMMAMIIPKDFSRYIHADSMAPVQLMVDGSDSNTATIAMGYVKSVVARYNEGLINDALAEEGISPQTPVELRPRIWFNEDLKSRNYIIPGLIAVIMMVITALLTSLTVAREWERGTMEQLISTPVTSKELIFGKFLPYFAIGLVDLVMAVAMAYFIFRIPFRGNIILLFGLSGIFLMGALTLGIWISIGAKNQLLASQIAILSTFMPAFLLSGFMYAITNMPKAIQIITYIIPARYFITILRGIYLKGVGFGVLWKPALFLCIFASLMVGLANRKFKKKVA